MRPVAALLSLALLAAGCGTRARLNPFDPANPVTGGRPTGFVAVAGNQSVLLSWEAASAPGLEGYQVLRLAPGDSLYRPITGVLPPGNASASDFGLLNGAEHRYRLHFVLTGGALGTRYSEDVATPGPLRPWVADVDGLRLARLSSDGRHVAQSLRVSGGVMPAAMDADRTTGRVWMAGDGTVVVVEPWTGAQRVIAQGLGAVLESVALAGTDPADGWIADASQGELVHLRPDGSAAQPPRLTGLGHPTCIAVDAADGSVWVADRDGGQVRRYTADGALATTAPAPSPERVAVDPATHEAWVTCPASGWVLRLAANGSALDTVTASRTPLAVAVDPVRRRVWVSDFGRGEVAAYETSGTRRFAVAGLPEPRRIALDPATGEAWVTVGGTGSVVRLSPSGALLQRVDGLGDPWDIALDDVTGHPVPGPGLAARRD